MRKSISLALLVCLWMAAVSCEITIPGGSVSTLVSEAEAIASKVAEAQTQTAGSHGAAPSPTATTTIAPPHLRVAFISGGSPWIVEPPAPAHALSAVTDVHSVDISDDGLLVSYVRTFDYYQPAELRVVNSDGTNDRVLLTSAQVSALEPLPDEARVVDLYQVKWIPGTHNLLVDTLAGYVGPGLARFDDLYQVDADTGVLTTVLTAGNAGEVWPSPDGTKMVISRATYISLANIDGTGLVPNIIAFSSIYTYSEYQYYPEPVWSADSSTFGVIIPSQDPLAADPSGAIWMVDAATGTASLASTLNGNFFFPKGVLSPALDRVGYVVTTADPHVVESYVSALDGSLGLHLGTGQTGVDSFAPDGRYFTYFVDSPFTKYIGSLGGGTILVPGDIMGLQWYNNTHFVYATGPMASWTLNIGDTAGTSTIIASPAGTNTSFDVDE